MELKVWVDGVARVVCGLSLNTSCQDVVISLAQSIGQTGRYVLILRLRGTEKQLVADDCPLKILAQLGQLATEVQFVLLRRGPSLSGQDSSARDRRHRKPNKPEAEHIKHRGPQKDLTYSLGPTSIPKRTTPNGSKTSLLRASQELRASPPFIDHPKEVETSSTFAAKEEVFRQILQQQRKLEDLEIHLQSLQRDIEVRERQSSSAAVPGLIPTPENALEELELRLRENEAELKHGEHWEQQLKAEMDREQDMHSRLDRISSSLDRCNRQFEEHQDRLEHLEEVRSQNSPSSPQQPDEALNSLKQELHYRLQQGQDLDVALLLTHTELQVADEKLKDQWDVIEELKKELRQCNLQQFIQQKSNTPLTDQTNSMPITDVYIHNTGIMD
ncbi:ras association domain-containing protein 7-like [Thalassophryne amazonica]|uniref:ras association domain-containing protein 7-like n=1 Tax=Thalassophryne amazonica TaxID=390379 RepID=UPI0014724FF7|nr:ras association domain-containing protein 7-like [Thalassophryne amazonica]